VQFDIFFSICQTDVDGYMPNERVMFENFFDQLRLADDLGFGTAWVAETHLSCEIQKLGSQAVIPHFKGEIGLNTDILQLAHVVFAQTKKINVGSAIRNILCNGGPIAHAEAVKTALSLNAYARPNDERKIDLGFASGRFDFSNRPYGINPRNENEKKQWPQVKSKVLHQAVEIFLRLLSGETLASADVSGTVLADGSVIPPFWNFEKVGVIPCEAPLERLNLTMGSHDPELQIKANQYLPVKIFNLSITPQNVIEETHARMTKHYHASGGAWQRSYMPRTALVYINEKREVALQMAERAWQNYWRAMEGTLDPKKVADAVSNTLAGTPEEVREQIRKKYHPEDRLMMWFDFNNHDNEYIKKSMRLFTEKIARDLHE
jgi:alkanesulfonate monooxygenase SsuD/methylene tetrahydromethanopterin reductase-like flavin-dependent oxidoreductase (luciferase family)